MLRYTELARRRQRIGATTSASAPMTKFRETPAANASPAESTAWSMDCENPAPEAPVCLVQNAGGYQPCPPIIGIGQPAVSAITNDSWKPGPNEKKGVAVDPLGYGGSIHAPILPLLLPLDRLLSTLLKVFNVN